MKVIKTKHIFMLVIVAIAVGLLFYYNRYIDVATTYYHASFMPPTGIGEELGIEETERKLKITELDGYSNDSNAVRTEREKLNRLQSAALDRMKASVASTPSSTLDSLRFINEGKVHVQILSEKHVIIAVDHVRSYDTEELIHKMNMFGVFSDEVTDYIRSSKLEVRFYPLY